MNMDIVLLGGLLLTGYILRGLSLEVKESPGHRLGAHQRLEGHVRGEVIVAIEGDGRLLRRGEVVRVAARIHVLQLL